MTLDDFIKNLNVFSEELARGAGRGGAEAPRRAARDRGARRLRDRAAPAGRPGPGAPPAAAPVAPRRPRPARAARARHREQAAGGSSATAISGGRSTSWKIALTIHPGDARPRQAAGRSRRGSRAQVAERIQEGRAALRRRPRWRRAATSSPRWRSTRPTAPPSRRSRPTCARWSRSPTRCARATRSPRSPSATTATARGRGDLGDQPAPAESAAGGGHQLKIPEIPGVPFVRPEPRREPRRPGGAHAGSRATPGPAPGPPPARPDAARSPPEVNPLLADAREALERKEYPAALAGRRPVPGEHARHRGGPDLKKVALYQLGKAQFDPAAVRGVLSRRSSSWRSSSPSYEDSPRLLQQARARVVEQHYTQGISSTATRSSRKPSRMAGGARVRARPRQRQKNIEQAEKLLNGLEQRKKKVQSNRQSGDRHHDRHVRTVSTLLPIIGLALILTGCPKRPAWSAATAPPPVPPPAAAPPTPPRRPRRPRRLRWLRPRRPGSGSRSPAAGAAEGVPCQRGAQARSSSPSTRRRSGPTDAKTLDASAAYLKANPNQLVLIEGHCDERGTIEYNLALGERRAKAAMNYLVARASRRAGSRRSHTARSAPSAARRPKPAGPRIGMTRF